MKVFVYGTLRSNQRYHYIIENQVKSAQRATVQGKLYHLPFGYPALLPGSETVSGELMTFNNPPKALEAMDELEGYYGPDADNEYERVGYDAVTEDGIVHSCFIYLYKAHDEAWLTREAVRVPQGDWVLWKDGKG